MVKRIFYFVYYLKELDKKKFNKFSSFVMRTTGKSKFAIWADIFFCCIRYNISILEYFNFHFYEIEKSEKRTFAGTGFMYEYQLLMNPKKYRNILSDKLIFLSEYKNFIKHNYVCVNDIKNDDDQLHQILDKKGKLVLKNSKGQCGIGIKVINSDDLTGDTLLKLLKETANDYVEEFVVQHPDLMSLSPSGLNTVRVITQINKNGQVDILGCRLRITINSSIDNLAAGNIAAPIDEGTGVLSGPAVYSDITRNDEYVHPVTQTKIVGFKVPFWMETIEMVKSAALLNTTNKSIGWDVAITAHGPELIEGNHDWCKLLWQLPVKKGLRPLLISYMKKEK